VRATPLRLLQLNIEYGGTGVDFAAVIAVINTSEASVVALQEGCGQVAEVAAQLGWPFFDVRTQVVSKVPLLDPPSPKAGVVLVEVEPGRVVAMANVHPASRAYGPFRLAKGERLRRVLRRERRLRVAELQPSIDAATALMSEGVPVVLLGDFNAPSHLDWTDAAVGALPQVTQPVRWPTSIAMEQAGLVDAYRAAFPDPVTHPGLTWPAERPFVDGYNPAADGQTSDRIDFMHVSPDITVKSIQIVGEQDSPFTDMSVSPWPTDHRGLLASLLVAPASPPPVVSVSRRLVTVGDSVTVRCIADGVASVKVAPIGADDGVALAEMDGDGSARVLDTADVGAGTFHVVAVDAEHRELARTTLWVAQLGTKPEVTTDRPSYRSGEAVDVRWSWAPGNRADWVAIYRRGDTPGAAKPMVKAATGATVEGDTTFNEISNPRKWPLAAGAYSAHLLMDDLPKSLASADFTIS
jgi:endonuclease/exonuclease/phosphatase family metal-dependent hydrolase